MEDKFFVGANKSLNIALSILTFVILMYGTIQYSNQVSQQTRHERTSHFYDIAAQASDLLHEKVKPFPLLLSSVRGLILGHEDLPPAGWSYFIDSLDLDYKSLGIIGLTYTESVFDFQRDNYIARRKGTFNDFRIFPEGIRDEYMVVLYLAPEKVSARVRGFDISVEKHRRQAAINARLSGRLTLTESISLLPTEAHSLDYLLLLPIYRNGWNPDLSLSTEDNNQFKGWATLGFSMSRLATEVIRESDQGLRLQLFDPRAENNPVFDSSPTSLPSENSTDRTLNAVLTLGDQALTVRITALPESNLAASVPEHDTESLISGTLISLLVSIILFLLLNSRFTAVRMASNLLEQFAESETRYKALFDLSPEAVIIHRKGKILLTNKAALHLLGASSPGILIGRNVTDYVHEESRSTVQQRMAEAHAGTSLPFIEERLLRCDGSNFLAEVSGAAIQFEGEPAVQVMFRDISGEQETRFEAQLSRAVFRHSHEPMMVTTPEGVISLINPAFTEVTGFTADQAIGKNASILSSGHHDQHFYTEMWRHLLAEGEWEGEMTNRKKDGEIYIQRAHISAIRGLHDEVTQFICVMSDITEQKKELENIRFQAMHDPLTRLPNRALFTSTVRKAANGNDGQHFAVLFIDLDGFKPVNDTHGHLLGDKLLVALARKLSGAVKNNDMVARVGGDEFLVLLMDIDNSQQAQDVAERLIRLIKEPLIIDHAELHLGASIGIAIHPDHAIDELSLIDKADKAMYQVKRSGKGRALLADNDVSEAALPKGHDAEPV